MPWRKRKYDGDDDEDAPAKKEKPTWTTPRKQLDAHSGDTYWKVCLAHSSIDFLLVV